MTFDSLRNTDSTDIQNNVDCVVKKSTFLLLFTQIVFFFKRMKLVSIFSFVRHFLQLSIFKRMLNINFLRKTTYSCFFLVFLILIFFIPPLFFSILSFFLFFLFSLFFVFCFCFSFFFFFLSLNTSLSYGILVYRCLLSFRVISLKILIHILSIFVF